MNDRQRNELILSVLDRLNEVQNSGELDRRAFAFNPDATEEQLALSKDGVRSGFIAAKMAVGRMMSNDVGILQAEVDKVAAFRKRLEEGNEVA
jgi:hypothetical protein